MITSNNINENLDKKVEDCRRNLLECPSWRLDSRCLLLDDLSCALYHRFQQLGGIEYLEESINCWRQGFNLCPIQDLNRSEQLGDSEEAITGTCHRQAVALLSHLTDIRIVHCLLKTLEMLCGLALSSWEE